MFKDHGRLHGAPRRDQRTRRSEDGSCGVSRAASGTTPIRARTTTNARSSTCRCGSRSSGAVSSVLMARFARASPADSSSPLRVYYGWPVLLVAAAAMVGTLPGRTQGLGLITEPLLADLHVDRVSYAELN